MGQVSLAACVAVDLVRLVESADEYFARDSYHDFAADLECLFEELTVTAVEDIKCPAHRDELELGLMCRFGFSFGRATR